MNLLTDESGLGDVGQTVAAVESEVDAEIQRLIPEAFSVRCADTASWVVRRILAARAYLERVKVWSEAEQRRARREEERLFFLFGGQLRAWAETEIAKMKGRRKSLALPGGFVGFRKTKATVIIDDEQVVLAWARANCPSAVVISERLSRSAFNEHVAATGEVPDAGIHLEAEREVFFVR